MTPITFKLNEPQILQLSDSTGDLDGSQVLYPTSDGRMLSLPRHAAVKLNGLWLQPGEEVSITRCQKAPHDPAEWVIALTARTEQSRAAREAAESTPESDLERQLAASIARSQPDGKPPSRATKPSSLREMPKSVNPPSQEPPEVLKGTGTYGPVPQVALGGRKLKPEAIPFNVAFAEVTRFVTTGLKEAGEQWNDQAKQDAICTILIAGSKAGYIGPWERP